MTVEDLKRECAALGLAKSGNKLELVLKLVRHKAGPGGPQKQAPAKRAADDAAADADDGAGEVGGGPRAAKKPRAPSVAKANLGSLARRVEAKIFCDTSKWSNQKSKAHATAVVDAAHSMLEKEAFAKGFVARRDLFALEVAKAILTPLAASLDEARGVGYCDMEAEDLASALNRLGRAMPRGEEASAAEGLLGEVRELTDALDAVFQGQCIDSFKGAAAAFASPLAAEPEASTAAFATPAAKLGADALTGGDLRTDEKSAAAAAASPATPAAAASVM